MLVGVFAAVVATVFGTLVGLVAGVARGAVDVVLMRLVDIMLTLPFVPLVIVLSAFAGPGFESTVLVIGFLMWARTARVLRSQVLSARERGPATAARAMGAGTIHVLWHHVLPPVFPLVIPEMVRAVNAAILLESSLAFLGLGDPTRLSWGSILYHANARSAFLTDAWLWWELPPGLCIGGTVLGFVLFGYTIDSRLRPRLIVGWRPAPPRRLAGAVRERAVHQDDDVVLSVEKLSVEYAIGAGQICALDHVSLSVRRGEVVGIVGESGSGKTTLVSAMMRLLPANAHISSGYVAIAGRDTNTLSDDAMRRLRGGCVALVPQSAMNALNPVRTLGSQLVESLTLHRGLRGRVARDRARELLTLVGIPANRLDAYPHELSGGMRQRVVIAIAISGDPQLLIADEPTTGLDVLTQAELLALLGALRTRLGLAIILVSHDLAVVASLANEIIVMQSGMIVERGPTRTVLTRPAHDYTVRLVNAIPLLAATRDSASASIRRSTTSDDDGVLLVVDSVHKSFGTGSARAKVLDDVTFSVCAGECVGLIGASGAGKSTLARLIVGLDQPDDGRILLDGHDVSRRSRTARHLAARRVHLVFQDPYDSLAPGMRVRDLIGEPCTIHGVAVGVARGRLVAAALEAVGLVPATRFLDAYPHELSGGERQRVALARAMILEPGLIVADEPTSQLDAPLRAEMVQLMRELGDRLGTAYLYITHDIAIASIFCQRLVILHQGRVAETGATNEIIASPRAEYTKALMGAVLRPLQ